MSEKWICEYCGLNGHPMDHGCSSIMLKEKLSSARLEIAKAQATIEKLKSELSQKSVRNEELAEAWRIERSAGDSQKRTIEEQRETMRKLISQDHSMCLTERDEMCATLEKLKAELHNLNIRDSDEIGKLKSTLSKAREAFQYVRDRMFMAGAGNQLPQGAISKNCFEFMGAALSEINQVLVATWAYEALHPKPEETQLSPSCWEEPKKGTEK